ncbi:MAG: YSC84-related protein [Desulfobacteraceae bacterium]|jgi:lipid-binding SYLF domain-containing protein
MKKFFPIVLVILSLCFSGCATTGKTPAEKRKTILSMKNDVLSDLYKQKPDVRQQIASAPGYAVFSNVNVNIIFASFGGGYGVVKNNKTGKYTYMKMGEVGVGLGLGAKDFRVVFVFHNSKTLNYFIEHGWTFGAQTDAAAKATDKGGAIGGEISANNITIYQLTETGLALQATVKGTKYWKDDSLN